jgi:hypothetical protein|tara:strand:+ start:77171 stop:79144 length:1974 start_codon:yes stop_codon:yes gene_type:complete
MSRNNKKTNVNRNDIFRAILTDTLPYEVPLKFSNVGYYLKLCESGKVNFPYPLDKVNQKTYSIPFNYKIKKDESSLRLLSIVHPVHQLSCAEFYAKFDQVILSLCTNNKYSLRYPADIASYFYEKNRSTEDCDVEWDAVDKSSNALLKLASSSYFSYERYNFMYKFYESYEFHRLERKFKNLLRLDISKCFHHIYTHSLSWAVKGKLFSKKHVNQDTFDGGFDKLMQTLNYNETNGIVIGPEISRVFSEIILQSIDSKIDQLLFDEGLKYGKDYEIRRYIDDYFIFYNNESKASQIESTLSGVLSEFKLYLNESKTVRTSRPFITGETIAKIEVGKLIDQYFSHIINIQADGVYKKESLLKPIWNKSTLSNSFIRDIKSVVKKNDVGFDSIISFSISIFIKLIKKVLNAVSNHKAKVDRNDMDKLKVFVLEVSFFVYSMSPKARNSYLICRLINLLKEEPSSTSDDSNVNKAIFDEVVSIIQTISDQDNMANVEVFNLAVTTETFGPSFILTENLLMQLFGIDDDFTDLDYFSIVCCLDYCGNKRKLKGLKKKIIKYIIHAKFESIESLDKSSEAFLLICDLLSCPYLSTAEKKSIAISYLDSYQLSDDSLNKVQIGQKAAALCKFYQDDFDWFYAWRAKSTDLNILLLRKELRTAY